MPTSTFYPVETFFLLGSALAYLVGSFFLSARLKRKHEKVWKTLGMPSVLNLSISNSWNLFRYIFLSKDYKKTEDRQIAAIIIVLRMLFVAVIVQALILNMRMDQLSTKS